ncbi:hypothetical protein AALP_AA6G068500 [Arabis alpina]|uniref:MATH domain-containing protein n=1 Tax=Arabis alpina TaxID=50452 RepID=A0A087GMK2_ARAAL|nr:hypothetical protein AALP_AA6G068500 [Arabis alpina]
MSQTSLEGTIKEQLKDRSNAHFLLVDGMSKLTTHKVNKCQSSIFHVSGFQWKLIIHPAGDDGRQDYLSFYVKIKDRESLPFNWEVHCSLKLSIVSQNKSIKLPWIKMCYNEDKIMNGEERFMSHKVLQEITQGFNTNDKVVFCAEITNVKPSFNVNVPRQTMATAEHLKLTELPQNKSRVTWKITQFSSFDGDHHSSHEFTVGPRKWKIMMYPKGIYEEEEQLSFYLNASHFVTKGPKEKTLAVYKLRVLDQDPRQRNHYEHKYSRWFHYGPDRLSDDISIFEQEHLDVPLNKLKEPSWGFMVRDQIYLGVEFLLVSTTEDL